MTLSASQIRAIRAEVGSTAPPSDADLDDIHEDMGTVAGVALYVVQARLADMLADPAVLNAQGDATLDWSANITELQSQATRLRAEHADALAALDGRSGGLGVARLVRPDRER
jgi:hypothetical protein